MDANENNGRILVEKSKREEIDITRWIWIEKLRFEILDTKKAMRENRITLEN